MVAHFETFRDMWSSNASSQMVSMVCWRSGVLSKVVRDLPAVMSSTYFQRLGAEAATWFTTQSLVTTVNTTLQYYKYIYKSGHSSSNTDKVFF